MTIVYISVVFGFVSFFCCCFVVVDVCTIMYFEKVCFLLLSHGFLCFKYPPLEGFHQVSVLCDSFVSVTVARFQGFHQVSVLCDSLCDSFVSVTVARFQCVT